MTHGNSSFTAEVEESDVRSTFSHVLHRKSEHRPEELDGADWRIHVDGDKQNKICFLSLPASDSQVNPGRKPETGVEGHLPAGK